MSGWKRRFCWKPLKHKGCTYWMTSVLVKYKKDGSIKKLKLPPCDEHMSIAP